jgi:hypothetical protein
MLESGEVLGGRTVGEAKGGVARQAHTSQRRMQDVSGLSDSMMLLLLELRIYGLR